VLFQHQKGEMNFEAIPSYFQNKVQLDPTLDNGRVRFVRAIDKNEFTCNARALASGQYKRYVPFRYSDELFLELLSDTLNERVDFQEGMIQVDSIQAFYSRMPADSVYQLMMQESDNFVAEQLLLTVSGKLLGIQDPIMAVDYIKDNYLADLTDEPRWVDGSGLSRYNLFTPRTLVELLNKIYQLLPEERLLNIFPAGGESGTIEKWYVPAKGNSPYVFAKTGTLSNKHCLSGYLKTKSGKTLIFSFMNNNYLGSSTPVKREMEKVLQLVRDNY
jgi:D-alanyl-D-alanine carboxypeptidase/D-alanyl-D-alanine-endopeptidase (penicillin-binding protein 4)